MTDEPVDQAGIDGWQVLESLASLPISSWRYKREPPGILHLGPMAQDFKAAFGLGTDDKTIAYLDANGVVMVSIQALYRRLTALEAEVASLRLTLAKGEIEDVP